MGKLSIGWCKREEAMKPQPNSFVARNAEQHGESIHEMQTKLLGRQPRCHISNTRFAGPTSGENSGLTPFLRRLRVGDELFLFKSFLKVCDGSVDFRLFLGARTNEFSG